MAQSRSIPFPDDREASALTEYVLHGAAADLSSAGAVPTGTAMVLSAEVGGYEYALYRFNPAGAGAGAPDSVSVLLEDGVTTEAWIGRADYDAGVWQFEGPFTKPKTLLLDEVKYISPDGNVWVAVMVAAEQSATVNALSVRTINPANQPPTAALDADVTSGNAPLTVSFDALGSADSDGTIIEYAWDFDGDGLYDGFSDGPQVSWVFEAAGLFVVKVRVTDDQFARATATVEINVNVVGNEPPLADFSLTPEAGTAPLSVDFDAALSSDPDGSIVRYDWDFDSDGIWDVFDGPPQVNHTYTASGEHSPLLRVTDDAGAQDTETRTLDVNARPVAAIHTDTPKGSKGETVSVIAAGFDSDGTIVDFEWDLDGDGVWNGSSAEIEAQGSSKVGVLLGDIAGEYGVAVRVTDNEGQRDSAGLILTVLGWLIVEVDTDGSVGSYTSLAVVAGHPAISYLDAIGGNLRYVFAQNEHGSVWNTPVFVDFEGSTGAHTSLQVVNGAPAISYYDSGGKDLKYAYSSSIDGTGDTDWSTVTVDSAADVGEYTSLAVINGKPAISYYDNFPNQDLKYAYSDTADGSAGWSAIAVDTTGNVGSFYTSLAVVDGKPAIGYFDQSNLDLKYAYSSTLDGANPGDWTLLTIDDVGGVGSNPSLAVVDGKPAISYREIFGPDLKYAYSSTVDGSSGWATLSIDAGVGAQNSSLAVVNGRPATSYWDSTNDDLKYAYSSTVDGSAGWTAIALDTVDSVGEFTSHAMLASGSPAISYYDGSNADLKYAVLFE